MRECAGQEVGIYIYFKMPLDILDMYSVDHKKRRESRDDAGASALGKRQRTHAATTVIVPFCDLLLKLLLRVHM